jgi:HEAT repeat protein
VIALACALGGSVHAQQAPARDPKPATAAKAPKAPRAAKAPKAAKPAKGAKAKGPRAELVPTIAALNGANPEAAMKAAETLGASAEPAAHEALLDALAMGLPPAVAIVAIGSLAHHPAPPDVTALERYASHRNPMVRSAALGSLAMYPDPTARKAVIAGLSDMTGAVRAAAAGAAAKGRIREAIPTLFELLGRGEESASKALAAMADADLARKIGEHLGKVPDALLAQTLGLVLKRSDFGPDPARVELVRAIGKIQDQSAVAALTDYIDATPKNPPRQSRQEAQKMVEARLGGGDQ